MSWPAIGLRRPEKGTMSLNHRVTAALVLALSAANPGLGAQTLREGELANIKALKCTFPVSTVVMWKDGVPEPRVRTTEPLAIEINEIDAADGSAIVGPADTGNPDVSVQVYGWNIHFLEVSRGGRIGVTTVFAQISTGDRLKATHTRTDYVDSSQPTVKSEPEVAMFYGDCEARR
jgi:hypothetical protein